VERRGVDDWHQLSWYFTNAAFNNRNKLLTSRWTHADEKAFITAEEGIYKEMKPKSTTEWKKLARSNQGVMDGWMEKHSKHFIN